MEHPFLEARDLTKTFSKVVANKRVSFSVRRGEIVALLGENGAGKSTAMKMVYGLYRPDSGSLLVEGSEVRVQSPRDAMRLGIAMIQQHFSLVEAHTVAENLALGSASFFYDPRSAEKAAGKLAAEHGFDLDPRALVRDLPVGVRQKVEILKALHQEARLLIMDEPTAVLTPQEAADLMGFVRRWASAGNAAVFITHKLKEVMEVSDRVVVMRSGEVVGDLARADTDERRLASLMIGRDLPERSPTRTAPRRDRVVLRVEGASVVDRWGTVRLEDASFEVCEGEVLGVAGVSGNGQQELCELAVGAAVPVSGSVFLDGVRVDGLGVRAHLLRGVGYAPADRHRDAVAPGLSVAENLALKRSGDKALKIGPFLDPRRLAAYADAKIADYSIKAGSRDASLRSLSGGNQQKVVVAREVDAGRRLLVFDQPTRGLDLGAIDYVHRTILAEREKGKAIVLSSTELSEIFALADRIAVLYRGAILGVFPAGELDAERLGLLMAGYSEGGSR